jgi:hypothetical protein
LRHKRTNGERVDNIPYRSRLAADAVHVPGPRRFVELKTNNRWSGARVAKPTVLESVDSKPHLSAAPGTVVNSVNLQTSQLYLGIPVNWSTDSGGSGPASKSLTQV